MSKWSRFAAWKIWQAEEDGRLSSPFARKRIGESSVFLYVQCTAPLPSGMMSGQWFSYPGVEDLISHLRFGVLPWIFGIWLCRDEWDEEEGPIELDDLFEAARTHESRYLADIPVMEKIESNLKHGADAEAEEAVVLLSRAIRTFNRRWKRTRTWDFELRVFPDIESVARDIRRRDCSELGKDLTMRGLAAAILRDRRREKEFRALLHEAAVC